MPAIASSFGWEKVPKGRVGIRWDNVVDNVWKEVGGNQEDILFMEKFGGTTRQKQKYRKKANASVKTGRTFRDIWEVKRKDEMKTFTYTAQWTT